MIDVSSYLTTDGAPLPVIPDLRPKAASVVIVPPFLKHFGGPMAGPAYLKGAGVSTSRPRTGRNPARTRSEGKPRKGMEGIIGFMLQP